MQKARAVRLVAIGGVAVSATTYVAFVMAGLNGDAWFNENKLWATIVLARSHVRLAWAFFAAVGILAFACRRRLRDRLLATSAALVGLPVVWATGLRFFYYNQPGGWWPGFNDEVWRWLVNHIYAEFSIGLMIGFLGLAAVTAPKLKSADPE